MGLVTPFEIQRWDEFCLGLVLDEAGFWAIKTADMPLDVEGFVEGFVTGFVLAGQTCGIPSGVRLPGVGPNAGHRDGWTDRPA